jgi:putative tryptophan/tyrosine transport system substrate-binding protein
VVKDEFCDGQNKSRSYARAIGVLIAISADDQGKARVAALVQGLRELGWVEGRNIRFDVRWLGGDSGRARDYAAELVRLSPDLLVANGPTVLDLPAGDAPGEPPCC